LIELRGVYQSYGDVEAVRGVTLRVERGEMLSLVGPNGSGKTTLLRMMAALETPLRGEVVIDGIKLTGDTMAELRRRCTMVFQRPVILQGSVFDNVAYGLRLRDLSGAETGKSALDALETVGLGELKDRKARGLSVGEQQRLSLARALALGCEVLLLDEPTANLDPLSLAVVLETLGRLRREADTTIVMATHNLLKARELSDRLALLDMGRVVEAGSPDELFASPSREMAGFARSENVFAGTVEIVEGISHVDIGGVTVVAAEAAPERATVHVRPQDIILSLEPLRTSARNMFKGTIRSVEDLDALVRLEIDVGRVFTVQITRRSFREMGLNVGSEVYIAFKASSVTLI